MPNFCVRFDSREQIRLVENRLTLLVYRVLSIAVICFQVLLVNNAKPTLMTAQVPTVVMGNVLMVLMITIVTVLAQAIMVASAKKISMSVCYLTRALTARAKTMLEDSCARAWKTTEEKIARKKLMIVHQNHVKMVRIFHVCAYGPFLESLMHAGSVWPKIR